jgi:hypothetical protein
MKWVRNQWTTFFGLQRPGDPPNAIVFNAREDRIWRVALVLGVIPGFGMGIAIGRMWGA